MCGMNMDKGMLSGLVSPGVGHDAFLDSMGLPKPPGLLNPSEGMKFTTLEGFAGDKLQQQHQSDLRKEEERAQQAVRDAYDNTYADAMSNYKLKTVQGDSNTKTNGMGDTVFKSKSAFGTF